RRGREKTRGRAARPAVWRVRSAASFFVYPQRIPLGDGVFIPSSARGTDTLVRREPRISAEIRSSEVQNWVRTPRADRKRHAMCPTRHELKRRLCVENRTV